MATSQVLYFPHGGGPLPLLGDPGHKEMIDFLRAVVPALGKPSAILVISAHWEEPVPTITSSTYPPLVYDYYGFPEESYQITYPAPGNPELAEKIQKLLKESGIESRLDEHRGFDHGLFIPLKIMYPDALIPCIQLSLGRELDPARHIRIGRALSSLRDENVLVLGSGFSYHNLRAFFTSSPGHPDPANEAFQDWLVEVCATEGLSDEEREKRLVRWETAPNARYCHPREEHLMPLHVCYGFSASCARKAFDGAILGKRALAFLW